MFTISLTTTSDRSAGPSGVGRQLCPVYRQGSGVARTEAYQLHAHRSAFGRSIITMAWTHGVSNSSPTRPCFSLKDIMALAVPKCNHAIMKDIPWGVYCYYLAAAWVPNVRRHVAARAPGGNTSILPYKYKHPLSIQLLNFLCANLSIRNRLANI